MHSVGISDAVLACVMGYGVVVLLAVAGCGRLAFDELGADANSGDATSLEESATEPAAPMQPFGRPQSLTTLVAGGDADDPTLTDDMLEIYFESTRSGGKGLGDLWYSARASTRDPWPAPAPMGILNSTAQEEHPGLSSDGLTIWFASNRSGGLGGYDIWLSTRASRTTTWSTPVLVRELSATGNQEAPQVGLTGLTMVLAWGPNSADENVMLSTRATTTSPWSTPVALPISLPSTTDSGPWLAPDERSIYFSSKRTGNHDIYIATRPSVRDDWSTPMPIAELDTDGDETDPWLSSDQREIVFVSPTLGLAQASR